MMAVSNHLIHFLLKLIKRMLIFFFLQLTDERSRPSKGSRSHRPPFNTETINTHGESFLNYVKHLKVSAKLYKV